MPMALPVAAVMATAVSAVLAVEDIPYTQPIATGVGFLVIFALIRQYQRSILRPLERRAIKAEQESEICSWRFAETVRYLGEEHHIFIPDGIRFGYPPHLRRHREGNDR